MLRATAEVIAPAAAARVPVTPVAAAANNNMRTSLKVVGLFGLLIVVALFGFWYYLTTMTPGSGSSAATSQAVTYSTLNTPYAALLKENSDFANADAYFNAGNYTSAIQGYRSSLALAKDDVQLAQIQYQIAIATERSGDVEGSIPLFQAIAQNTKFYPIIRAFAVQALGLMLVDGAKVNVRSDIFSNEPYATFLRQRNGDESQATADIFDYAASIYPLAVPLLVSANADLLRARAASSTSAASTANLIAEVKDKVSKADADTLRASKNENEKGIVPLELQLRAKVEGGLARIGGVPAADADAAFKLAINTDSALGPGRDGYDRYNYASYLLSFNGQRNADIHTLLAPFYTDQAYKTSPAVSFFTAEEKNVFGYKVVLQKLAVADPSFKTYLISLGWNNADFK